MLVVDLSQVLFATFFASVKSHTNIEIEEPLIRHMTLNVLRSINSKHRRTYGKMVIASDSTQNWRREIFPHYKAARRKGRAKSDMDWKSIFRCMDTIKDDLKTYFPYKFLQIERAEADDIIAVLAHNYGVTEPFLIVSGDKDFRQLHFNSVRQYDPTQKKMITEPDPIGYLKEHIIRGDISDGIPNALSDDDTFVTGKRQKALTKNAFKIFEDPSNIKEHKYQANYSRNKTLIDLTQIPQDLVDQILNAYNEPQVVTDRSQLLPYMMKHGMKNLVQHVADF